MRNIPFYSSQAFAIMTYIGWAGALVWLIAEPRLLTLANIFGWTAAMLAGYNLRFLLDWLAGALST